MASCERADLVAMFFFCFFWECIFHFLKYKRRDKTKIKKKKAETTETLKQHIQEIITTFHQCQILYHFQILQSSLIFFQFYPLRCCGQSVNAIISKMWGGGIDPVRMMTLPLGFQSQWCSHPHKKSHFIRTFNLSWGLPYSFLTFIGNLSSIIHSRKPSAWRGCMLQLRPAEWADSRIYVHGTYCIYTFNEWPIL